MAKILEKEGKEVFAFDREHQCLMLFGHAVWLLTPEEVQAAREVFEDQIDHYSLYRPNGHVAAQYYVSINDAGIWFLDGDQPKKGTQQQVSWWQVIVLFAQQKLSFGDLEAARLSKAGNLVIPVSVMHGRQYELLVTAPA